MNASEKTPSDPAKARFLAITLVRWAGVGLVVIGLLATTGRIDLPAPVGPVLVLFGLFDALVMPTILARRWKSRNG
ncbi:MAG: hypothetical protein V4579_01190 [Pseudomonadota bacterium]